ncbi:MAG: cob(I)yrinic acid a,c-diamide adenosyltransferase [Candidatus Aenigmarchaeota archaeon]|nr:cob(I)yrinic acid a,c-diamide adenosyltransferase [Candidatus Aenigmarchaeota archaeon]
MQKRALVYLWTGLGAGKTTSALGAALRQLGHGHRVTIIQFMKGRKYVGEIKIAKKLGPKYKIHQFGRAEWVDVLHPSKKDKELAAKGLEFAYTTAKQKPNLLILDEINYAVALGLLSENDVLKFLDTVQSPTVVYMTGRFATLGLINRADFVTEVVTLKMPAKITPKKGVDY